MTFTSLLLPIKLNEPKVWSEAVEVACRLASTSDAKLTLGTIIPHWVTDQDADYSWEARKWFEIQATNGLRALQAQMKCPVCETLVHWGSVPGSILDMAEEVHADLIVLPLGKARITDFLMRRPELRLAGRAHCSVLLVRSAEAQ